MHLPHTLKNGYSSLLICMLASAFFITGCGENGGSSRMNTSSGVYSTSESNSTSKDSPVTLRIANCEEYIDEGGWDRDERIDLEDGSHIFGNDSLVEDFEKWYRDTYARDVKVVYSTYGTNEELYNQMSLGNVFDLVCPSEYMIMKLMGEGRLEPYSDGFFDKNKKYNYYAEGVSPYIEKSMNDLIYDGESLGKYGAGYMWGTLGTVYNPEYVDEKDTDSFDIFRNKKYKKQVTIKDSIRDTYFAGLGALKKKELESESFRNDPEYHEKLGDIMNLTDKDTVSQVQDVLAEMRQNCYSMETDSGKADMVSGKVKANLQWSGDAVYTMDQAEEDGVILNYAVPDECTNLWFDGWVMMKNGIGDDPRKKAAAEAFVNFISRPDNVIRNMYYIGYTSAISGGDDPRIFEYLKYCYEAEDKESAVPYDLNYFFHGEENEDYSSANAISTDASYTDTGNADAISTDASYIKLGEVDDQADRADYVIMTSPDQLKRQLFAQYPPEDVIKRSAVMKCFDQETNSRMSQMWINIRCFSFRDLFK
ncbi:MAG: extracellular solute-binding protein [Lachnospiraceae bacterium]|jgi:spermidine/putrescine transport system substrate-binding protein|nr:extracellular solute-binding protein [Lachnospiraceae bacterium]